MSKKNKRLRKKTMYIGLEGYREVFFVEHIMNLYFSEDDKSNSFIDKDNLDGGTPISMLKKVIEQSIKKKKAFLIIDNDTSIDKMANKDEIKDVIKKIKNCWGLHDVDIPLNVTLKELASYNIHRKKPIIIASEPINMDGLIIKVFNKDLPTLSSTGDSEQDKQRLKNMCDNILRIRRNSDKEEKERQTLDFYENYLSKRILEQKRTELPSLNEIIEIFEQFY